LEPALTNGGLREQRGEGEGEEGGGGGWASRVCPSVTLEEVTRGSGGFSFILERRVLLASYCHMLIPYALHGIKLSFVKVGFVLWYPFFCSPAHRWAGARCINCSEILWEKVLRLIINNVYLVLYE
jgi:hypothetical protein